MNETETLEIYQQVLDSGLLGKSPRQAKLLKHLLTRAAEGQSESVNETTIAINVFDRDLDFDASTDSVVRVEMHRLRKNLSIFSAQNDIQLELPRASYEILVSRREAAQQPAIQTEPPSQVKQSSIVGTVILCLLAGFIWKQTSQEHFAPLQESSRPSAQLSIDIKNQSLKNEIDEVITQTLTTDNGLDLSTSESADYNMFIKDGNQALLLELWSIRGKLIHSRSIDIEQLEQQQIMEEVKWLLRYEFLQDSKSKMVIDYASASWVDPRKKQIHRCLSDAQSLIVGADLYYYEVTELADCLSELETYNAQDTARMNLDLALLSMQQARGYHDLGVDNPLKVATELTDKAETIMGPHRQIMVNRIYYYWVVGAVPGETAKLLQSVKKLYPSDQTIANMRSMTYALYLNDWESLDPMSETALELLGESNVFSSIAAIPLARSVLADNEDHSYFWLNKMNSTELPYSLWGLAIGCKFNNAPLINAHQSYLLEAEVESFTASADFVQSLKYSPELTTALAEPLQNCLESAEAGWWFDRSLPLRSRLANNFR